MQRAAAVLIACTVLTGLTGCRALERLTGDREPTDAQAKAKDRNGDWLRDRQERDPAAPPGDWLAGPATPGRGTRLPPADRTADPTSRNFDPRAAGQRTLSGVIEDADGKRVPNAYITVENADPIKAGYGAPMGVESDREGYFEINGLNPGEHYMLACQLDSQRPQAGRVAVQVPNTRVRLRLREDYVLPPGRGASSDLPPPAAAPAPSGDLPGWVPPPPRSGGNAQDWSPLVPNPNAAEPSPAPRPDLTAPGPQPDWRSTMPPANIPGPAPSVPPPPLLGPSSNAPSRESQIQLLDRDRRSVKVLSGRADDLVLLDFLTSTCAPCKRSIPTLVSFSNRYGKSVELIGVLCDPVAEERRAALANAYRKENQIPYRVLAEDSQAPIQDQFGIESYPTLVLLDGTGRRLWKGHPSKLAEVERILQNR